MNLKTTISSTTDIYDINHLWLPKGNYYYTIRKMKDGIVEGDLIDRGLKVVYRFNYINLIRMMSNAQARLARRANIKSPNMPDILSPISSPHRSTPNLLACDGNRGLYSTRNTRNTTSLPNISQNRIISNNTSTNTNERSISTREDNREKCAICLDVLTSGTLRNITTLRCNHNFHKNCIDRWKIRKNTCPVCRKRIRTNSRTNRSNHSSYSPYRSSSSSSRHHRSTHSRYVIRNTNQRSNILTGLPSIEERYASRRDRYYRNIS
tara:strand:+ start:956 stop:1750 length:795 start_codon:yes stop_codon:yes gene_type:complete